MALKQEIVLSQRLEQKLVLTPQLQMAIKLLQLTRLELSQYVAKELEENPTLDDAEFEEEGPTLSALLKDPPGLDGDPPLMPDEEGPPPASRDELTLGLDLERQLLDTKPLDNDKQPEMDWDSYFDSYVDGPSDSSPRDSGDEERPGFEQFYSKDSSLADYLVWQLKFSGLADWQLGIGIELIGNINEDGFIKDITLGEVAQRLGQTLESVEAVHHRLLRCEPLGVGARDLRECLLAQVRFGPNRDPLAQRILSEHWELLEKRNLPKMARLLKVDSEEVERALRLLSRLNPRPGSAYDTERVEYVVPDIYILRVGGEYVIQLNEDGLPRLRLSSYYQKSLADRSGGRETREFIKGKLRSATWLIRSIHQRQRTIYKVTEAIVRHQRDFLDHGVRHLKPMVLSDIAVDIGMHECTVSRVTTNKFVHTPQGIFELKFFFPSGIQNAEGTDVSSEAIKDKIKDLIDQEDGRKPLSDEKLVKLLQEDGMDVARRTVAKYREMLGILSSSGRRRAF